MTFKIDSIAAHEYPQVVELWEASVRATHHFLVEADIQFFKPLILNEYLKAVQLSALRDSSNRMLGFLGIADQKIEMLFVHPDARGKGVGKILTTYAIQKCGADKVDVNEQNEQAVGFYQHMGFVIVSRAEFDGLGKPYPILSMQLEK